MFGIYECNDYTPVVGAITPTGLLFYDGKFQFATLVSDKKYIIYFIDMSPSIEQQIKLASNTSIVIDMRIFFIASGMANIVMSSDLVCNYKLVMQFREAGYFENVTVLQIDHSMFGSIDDDIQKLPPSTYSLIDEFNMQVISHTMFFLQLPSAKWATTYFGTRRIWRNEYIMPVFDFVHDVPPDAINVAAQLTCKIENYFCVVDIAEYIATLSLAKSITTDEVLSAMVG